MREFHKHNNVNGSGLETPRRLTPQALGTTAKDATGIKALKELKAAHLRATFKSVRSYALPAPKYSDKTANGLTTCIIDYVRLNDGYANRINTMGVRRGGKWTRSTTAKGTPDITGIVRGRAFTVEVKIGRDKLSDAQIKQAAKIVGAGGLYFVAKDFETFYQWFNQTFEQR